MFKIIFASKVLYPVADFSFVSERNAYKVG